jgi:hypothetical protein
MIGYFSRKRRSIATSLLACLLFLNVLPGLALASQIYHINGQEYWVYGQGETPSTAKGVITITLQPGQSFNETTGAVFDPAQEDADSMATSPEQSTGGNTFPGSGQPFEDENGDPIDTAGTQGIPTDGAPSTAPGAADIAQQSIESIGTCSIGAILGRLLASLIGRLISTITNFFTRAVSEVAMQVVDCASHFLQICNYSPNQANQTGRLVQKSVGGSSPSPSGLIGNYIPDISLDSIMFCIINEIITYITESTIQWINSGFEGNPVFIQNPGALMQRVASQEANNFIYTAANGTEQAVSSGVHQTLGAVADRTAGLVGVLGESVTRGLISSYARDSSGNFIPIQPTLSDAQMRNPRFLGNWSAESQRFYPGNYNPVAGAYGPLAYSYVPGMNAQIAQQQAMTAMQAQWNSGYYPFTACPPGQERPADGSCKPNSNQTLVQGSQVKGEAEARNLTKYIRTATANSFDAIVTALVNQLVKVAINKVFEVEQKVDGKVQGAIQGR